jgi:hypothetical protein
MHFWFDAVGDALGSSFEPVSLPYERNGCTNGFASQIRIGVFHSRFELSVSWHRLQCGK